MTKFPDPAPRSRQAAHWDDAYDSFAGTDERRSSYAMANEFFQDLLITRRLGGPADWVEWATRKVNEHGPLERVLFLGCGIADGLVDFHSRGLCRSIVGVDASEVAIDAGREIVAERGLSDAITLEVGDFETLDFSESEFDAAVFVMSLHHSFDPDDLLRRVRTWIRPGGWLVLHEYVGPNRWQFGPAQLALIKLLSLAIPPRLRRTSSGELKPIPGRPSLEWMIETDPSEAAASESIDGAVERHFEVEHRVDYGGAVVLPVFDLIAHHFGGASSFSRRYPRLVAGVESAAERLGLVPNCNSLILARPRPAR